MKTTLPIICGLLACGGTTLADTPPAKPNIIFILADDLGIDDVGCYGSDTYKTPQIDKLAESGMRFETCYAAPLCGPSRCLLMTGRYAFRTGGLDNRSWNPGGTGAKSVDERPIAKLLRQGGYATGMAGKWRQIGETPSEWGFQEYITDPEPTGWYWQTTHLKNGQEITLPEGTYAPDVIQDFTLDFIRRHKDQPFFFYYSMHLVHSPIEHTPDSLQKDENVSQKIHYADDIAYVDKQVGALVAELDKLAMRERTLVIFSGDNGTAGPFSSAVRGRMLLGHKGTMTDGGSRVPLIASWPGTIPAGKVCQDIVGFADPHATFLDLAGIKPPEGFALDGRSFAPQLRGEKGTPREWAFVQLRDQWFVREPGFKMNEKSELFDMGDAPFEEKLIPHAADTEVSRAVRARLAEVLAKLDPAGGKKESPRGREKGKPAEE